MDLRTAARRLLDAIEREEAETEIPLLVSTRCPVCTANTCPERGAELCARHELEQLLAEARS